MFNVTVLKMKDIKKYFIGMVVTVTIIVVLSKYFPKNTNKKETVEKVLTKNSLIECLDETIPTTTNLNKEEKNINEKDILQEILKTQISSIEKIETSEEKVNDENAENQQTESTQEQETITTDDEKIELAQTNLETQVITNNPIKESFNNQYGKVKIKNETEYNLTQDMLKPDVSTENRNVILYHTHTCESYTSSEAYSYTPTGNFRTTDLNYTVVRVGTELENQLKQYNFNIIHDKSYHDYPSYNGSYAHSLETVENILKTTSSDIIIDLHRDAIGSRSDYAPTVKIGENDVAAQVMFVIRNK